MDSTHGDVINGDSTRRDMTNDNSANADGDSTRDVAVKKQRAEDLERAAKMGQARIERERSIKEKIKSRKAEEAERAHAAADAAAEHVEERKEAKKEWRKDEKQRKKEVEEDKARRAAMIQHQKDLDEAAMKKRKEEIRYMTELREAGDLRFAIERKKNEEKLRRQKIKHDADLAYSVGLQQADTGHQASVNQAQIVAQQRKSGTDAETQKKMYALDTWKRMKAHDIEVDVYGRTSREVAAIRDPLKQRDKKFEINTQAAQKRKQLEAEFDKKKAEIDQWTRQQKSQIDAEHQTAIEKADTTLLTQRNLCYKQMLKKLEEL